MSLGFKIDLMVPVRDWYVSYKVGNEFRSTPIAALAAVLTAGQHDLVPLCWNVNTEDWVDGRAISGFLAVVKSKSMEAHYQATEVDLERALSQQTDITTKDRIGMVETASAKLLAKMIAHKRVRQVLANKLPT